MIGFLYLLRRGRPDETEWEQIDSYSEDNAELALMKAPSETPEGLKFMVEWRIEGIIIQRARMAISYAGMPHPSLEFTQDGGLANVRWWFTGVAKEWRMGNSHSLDAAINLGKTLNDPMHENAANVYLQEQFQLLYDEQTELFIKLDGLEFTKPEKPENPFDNLLNILKDDDDGESTQSDIS